MDAIGKFEGMNANLQGLLKLPEDSIKKVQGVQRVLGLIESGIE